jgi:serine protease inhibitor
VPSQQSNPELTKLVNGNTAFAIDLYHVIAKPGEDVFFSPYSISIALAMTFVGARGETARQMAEVLHFSVDPMKLPQKFSKLEAVLKTAQHGRGSSVVLRSANSLYPQESFPILPSFLQVVKKHYGVTIEAMDYKNNAEAAREKINAWVESETDNKISDLITPGVLTPLTRLVLVNAIYFKGDWANPFDQADTGKAAFWVTPDRSINVEMMNQTKRFEYGETEQMQLLRLPYVSARFSMLLLLPKPESTIEVIESMLSVEQLQSWCNCLRHKSVDVSLPQFKLDVICLLKEVLQKLGMQDAFDDSIANFSGMGDDLSITSVIHKAFVEVNEKGTEAAAATAVIEAERGISYPEIFRADRPFLFLIQENSTDSILFMGKLASPI